MAKKIERFASTLAILQQIEVGRPKRKKLKPAIVNSSIGPCII